MARVKLSAVILLAILLLCVGALWYIHHTTQGLLARLDGICAAVDAEDYTAAAQEEAALLAAWADALPWLRVTVTKSGLLEISGGMARLRPLIASENDELGAELGQLRRQLVELRAGELPVADRIF